ncbi:MAG TPA: hypothetical protein PLD14_02475 [Candidatus Pacearchaeota archaeon]|nr:hypothetical protein [Candidatus Pacearchaeota archaeon]HPR80067.1 hypothetical protein [Candidatus Pacearchaeota archaeon]
MQIIKAVFLVLGAIFLLLIIAAITLIIIKPYGIDVTKLIPVLFNNNPTSTYDHPYLTTQQEAIFESIGIDPKDIPTEISDSQKKCAISILGEDRANEIVAGAIPSIKEIVKLKDCLDK